MAPALADALDTALADLLARPDSRYHELWRRWLEAEDQGVPAVLWVAMLLLLAGSVALAGIALYFRSRALGSHRALHRTRARLAATADAVGMGLWEWDERAGRVAWDGTAGRLYGLSDGPGEASVDDWLASVDEADRDRVREDVRHSRATLEDFETRFRVRRPDGTDGHVETKGRFVDVGQGHRTMIGVALDVSAVHELESRLRQAQRIEAVGALAGGIAHDFNNLLMVINNGLDLAREDVRDPGTRQLLDDAREAGERGTELTRRLLSFARNRTIDPVDIDLGEQVRAAVALVRRTLPESIDLVCDFHEGPLPVRVDPGQLENAVINLSVNARDAMPRGGRLHVRTLRETDAGGRLRHTLEINDTGEGIPASVVDRVFDPFFTTKELGHGTGLGLSMVHGFTRSSGGDVEIRSEEGHGTRIRLCFPAGPDTGHPPIEAADDGPAPRGPHLAGPVLVVEDDDAVRRLVERILDALGLAHRTCSDGPRALELLRSDPEVGLLLSDVVLPGGMGGVELVAAARRRRPDLPVILMTGYPGDAVGTDAPANVHWLGKPFTRDALSAALARVLAGTIESEDSTDV